MKGTQLFRFSCIVVLWLLLCWLVLTRTDEITLMTVFSIVASGIIVFVPLYKKYRNNGDSKE